MTNIMKKLLILGLMATGVMAAAKAPALAHSYETSTWTARFVMWIATNTDPSRPQPSIGGRTPSKGGVDISRVWISTGFQGYFVCVDSMPLAASEGSAYTLSNFTEDQWLFTPMEFLPSTATLITGGYMNRAQHVSDFRDYNGGGRNVKNGVTCFIAGGSGKNWWSLEFLPTPSGIGR